VATYNHRVKEEAREHSPTVSAASLLREATGIRSWRLGRYLGTVLYVDSSWPLALILLAWALAAGYLPRSHPQWPVWERWLAGSLIAALYFLATLGRELIRAFLARALGEPADRVNVHFFGRASQAGDQPPHPLVEPVITVAGPVISLTLAAFLSLAAHLLLPPGSFLDGLFDRLAVVLAYSAGFSLLPGLPLDGGRLLRLAWWQVTKDLRAASRAAAWAGQTLAFLLVVYGALRLFQGDRLTGLWVTSAGWLLRNAAVSSFRQIVVREVMAQISAERIMSRDFTSVSPDLTLRQLMEEYVVRRYQHAYPVLDDGRLLGIVCPHDISRVDSLHWDNTSVREVMTPTSDLLVVSPEDDGNLILERLALRDLNQLPVVDRGRLAGMVSRNDVLRFLQWQTDMDMYT
jgi:CBS domain-containing protein